MRAPAGNRSIRVIPSHPLPAILPRCSVMTLEAIRYRTGSLQILNQLLLPHQTVYDDIRSVQDAYEAIKSMKVRGSSSPLSPNLLLSPAPPACPARLPHVHSVPSCMCGGFVLCFVCVGSFVLSPLHACRHTYMCSPPSACIFVFGPTCSIVSPTFKPSVIYSFHIMCKRDKTGCLRSLSHPAMKYAFPPLFLLLLSLGEIIDELLMTFARVVFFFFCSRFLVLCCTR